MTFKTELIRVEEAVRGISVLYILWSEKLKL